MATLQQQVQRYLQNTGISLRELSRRSGVSHTAIGKILKGGDYKNKTAYALNTVILRDSNFAKIVCSADDQPSSLVLENRPAFETLDATVEQLAAQCIDSDLTHVRDTDLECAKYRRVMALEAEVSAWRGKADKAGLRVSELDLLMQRRDAELSDEKRNFAALEQVHEQREQHLKSCENALIEADQKLNDANTAWVSLNTQHGTTTQQLSDARADIKRLTALSDTHGQSWKAVSVQAEQLQKQLDHSNQKINELYAGYSQQVDDEREMLAQIDTLFTERDNMRTEYEYKLTRLRVRCFALVCAIVFLVVSGLVLWGAV